MSDSEVEPSISGAPTVSVHGQAKSIGTNCTMIKWTAFE